MSYKVLQKLLFMMWGRTWPSLKCEFFFVWNQRTYAKTYLGWIKL